MLDKKGMTEHLICCEMFEENWHRTFNLLCHTFGEEAAFQKHYHKII